jgi:hypothetical protein
MKIAQMPEKLNKVKITAYFHDAAVTIKLNKKASESEVNDQ